MGVVALFLCGWIGASYTDSETSYGNMIDPGTLDLVLSDGEPDPNNPDSVIHTWMLSDMIPGVSATGIKFFAMENTGSMEAGAVDIELANVCTDPAWEAGANEESDTLDGAEGMDRYLQIAYLRYGGHNLLYAGPDDPGSDQDNPATPWNETDDVNGNGFVDLDDLEAQPLYNLVPTPEPEMGSAQLFKMRVRFHESAGNEYQGDQVESKFTVTLKQ